MPEPQISLSNFNRPLDAATMLSDGATLYTPATTVGAGSVGQVAGANKTVDLGPGRVTGQLIVDLQAIDVGSGDEQYLIFLYGADLPTFGATSNAMVLATLLLGDALKNFTNTPLDSQLGRYTVPFTNVPFRPAGGAIVYQPVSPTVLPGTPVTNNPFNGTPKRYVRSIHVAVIGTVTASSLDYLAYLSIDQ